MPTTTKTTKTKPAAKGRATPRFPRTASGRPSTPRRPQFSRPGAKPAKEPLGLMGRARGKLPGRKPKGKKQNGWKDTLAGLGSANFAARKSSKKGVVGIVMGAGLGAAAIANHRRSSSEKQTSPAPMEQP